MSAIELRVCANVNDSYNIHMCIVSMKWRISWTRQNIKKRRYFFIFVGHSAHFASVGRLRSFYIHS